MTLPSTLSAAEASAIRTFMMRARSLLGSELKEALLFGSRARGEGHEHSDIDIAVIVQESDRARRNMLYDLAFDIGLEYGVELAPLVFDRARFEHLKQRERRIATDIEREGIPL